MFDMGFTEMMLIGIVALIVIGPERLPGVARTAGKYFGRLKRFMTSVKADVEQELRADELRQILADQQRELDTLKDSINEAGREIEKEAHEAGESLQQSLDDHEEEDEDANDSGHMDHAAGEPDEAAEVAEEKPGKTAKAEVAEEKPVKKAKAEVAGETRP